MRNLHTVLYQKEQDIARVRVEIQALLTVLPLLADEEPSSDDLAVLMRLASSSVAKPTAKGMVDLETYYPFVRHMRMSEPKEGR